MYSTIQFDIQDLNQIRAGLIELARDYKLATILDSHSDSSSFQQTDPYSQYDILAGFAYDTNENTVLSFEQLDNLSGNSKNWFFGYLSFDIKNSIENLSSNNTDQLQWPEILFFQPDILIKVKNKRVSIFNYTPEFDNNVLISKLKNSILPIDVDLFADFKSQLNQQAYIDKIRGLQQHIHTGDIYEINFCHEFYSQGIFDPYAGVLRMGKLTPSPFSAFMKYGELYALCASPERFLQKQENRLITQPIKGTAKRNSDAVMDEILKSELSTNEKERAENIMIVDLVRNDLSKVATKGSVNVVELCSVYSFSHVHQMISTLAANTNTHSISKIIKALFPMGSMTGAPKISALQLIEKFEETKRGLYSGTIGYFDPAGNFDLNVVIRCLQYHSGKQYLSYMTGSAITALSDPEKEYDECLLKAYVFQSIMQLA